MDFQNNPHPQRSNAGEQGNGRVAVNSTSRPHFSAPTFSSQSRQAEVHHEKPKVSNEREENDEVKSKKMIGFLEGAITFALVALFFGVPLFFTGLTFQGLAFEKQIYFYFWMLIALVAWTSKGVITGEMKIKRTPLDIPIIILVVFYSVATFFSVDRWHSFWGFFGDPSRGLMNLLGLVIVYYIITSHYTKKRFFQMLGSLAVANFILAVWAFLQVMGVRVLSENLNKIVPASSIGSFTGLGIFLGMMLPLLIVLILHLKSGEYKKGSMLKNSWLAFLLATLIVDIVLMLVLYAFISWLGVLAGISIFLIYILARIVRPAENWTWVPMVVFVSILAILMVGTNSIARATLPLEVSPSYKMSWDIAKESLKHSMLIGSGPATYGFDFSSYHPKDFNADQFYNLRFYQGSGMFFEAISTTGILGTIVVVLFAITFVGAGLYMLSTDKQKNKLYSLGAFTASMVVLINSFAGRIEGSMIIIGALVGALSVAVLISESDSEQQYLSLSLKASPKYALALAFVFMVVSAGVVFLFVFIGKVFIADFRAGSGVRETQISEQGSIAKMIQAMGWYQYEGRYFTRTGQEYLVLANNEALKTEKERDMNAVKGYLQKSIAYAQRGRDMMPTDALAQETLAQTYENAGLYVSDSLTLAEQAYKRALEIEPHNPLYMVKLGQIKISLGAAKNNNNPDDIKAAAGEAKTLFQNAIDEKQNLDSAYYQLALAQELRNEIDGAIDSMQKAFSIDNTNVNYAFNLARLHQIRGNDEDRKIAESLYKSILQANDKDVNTHFSLGLLYEKMKKSSEASAQYKKVLELIPAEQKETKAQVQRMIDNIARGIENTPENIKSPPVAPQPVPEVPTPDLIPAGAGQ